MKYYFCIVKDKRIVPNGIKEYTGEKKCSLVVETAKALQSKYKADAIYGITDNATKRCIQKGTNLYDYVSKNCVNISNKNTGMSLVYAQNNSLIDVLRIVDSYQTVRILDVVTREYSYLRADNVNSSDFISKYKKYNVIKFYPDIDSLNLGHNHDIVLAIECISSK